jgi:hypothetical protein
MVEMSARVAELADAPDLHLRLAPSNYASLGSLKISLASTSILRMLRNA